MQTTYRIIIVTLCVLFLVGGVAACKRSHHGGFDEFDLTAVTDRIASRLDLTDNQSADLKQIAGEVAEKAKALHADHESQHQALADLVRQDAIARDEVDTLIDEKLQKVREMADFAAERMIAFHATLTPEQREKVAVHIEEHSTAGCRTGWH
jgi:protein CpxP